MPVNDQFGPKSLVALDADSIEAVYRTELEWRMERKMEPRWVAVDERTEKDNFFTSIYENDYNGLLVARCNQNGSYPWQATAIIRGLVQNKQLPSPQPPDDIKALVEELHETEEWYGLAPVADLLHRAADALERQVPAGMLATMIEYAEQEAAIRFPNKQHGSNFISVQLRDAFCQGAWWQAAHHQPSPGAQEALPLSVQNLDDMIASGEQYGARLVEQAYAAIRLQARVTELRTALEAAERERQEEHDYYERLLDETERKLRERDT